MYYLAPYGDDEIAGLNRFDVYYVEKVDNNTIKLKDTSDSVINLTGYGSSSFGQHQLGLAYELHSVSKTASNYNIYWDTVAHANSGVGSGRDLTTSIGTYGLSGSTRPRHLMFCARG